MRDRSIIRSAAAAAIVACVGAGSGVALAQTPIKPRQHFAGIVNGQEGSAVVYTVCPGPITRHRFGPLKGGQTMAVAETASGPGYTGPFSQVYSWFQPLPAGATSPVTLTFTEYGVAQNIPASVRVPCDGTGQAVFSSCPYHAPCPFGWVPDTVRVKFENIAVSLSRGGARGPRPCRACRRGTLSWLAGWRS
jgi:hypothetical protein